MVPVVTRPRRRVSTRTRHLAWGSATAFTRQPNRRAGDIAARIGFDSVDCEDDRWRRGPAVYARLRCRQIVRLLNDERHGIRIRNNLRACRKPSAAETSDARRRFSVAPIVVVDASGTWGSCPTACSRAASFGTRHRHSRHRHPFIGGLCRGLAAVGGAAGVNDRHARMAVHPEHHVAEYEV